MRMSVFGIGFILVGGLMLIFTSFSYLTTDKVAAIGDLVVTRKKEHPVSWPPFLGVALMAIGIMIVVSDKGKRTSG